MDDDNGGSVVWGDPAAAKTDPLVALLRHAGGDTHSRQPPRLRHHYLAPRPWVDNEGAEGGGTITPAPSIEYIGIRVRQKKSSCLFDPGLIICLRIIFVDLLDLNNPHVNVHCFLFL